jgi:hypothetical protein
MSGKLGRPRKVLDENKISELVGKGFTYEFVADFFGVHVDTLYANYSEALRKGKVFREGCLQAKLYKSAMTGNVTNQIWLSKQWLGFTDKSESKVTVRDETPEVSHLSDAELEQVRSIIDSAERVG